MKVQVRVWPDHSCYVHLHSLVANFVVDYDDPKQRAVLGEQVANALRAGQVVLSERVEK